MKIQTKNKEFCFLIEVVFVFKNHFKQSKRKITKKKYKGIF